MPETEDPRAALQDKDVAVRASAARDLAVCGELSDVPRLLELATSDRSPSVRLYTAAAMASVLRRCRADGPLDRGVADQVMDALRMYDPQGNPGVLLALGAVGPSVRGRLGRLMKDPHFDVRQAAVAAVRAEALSPLALDDTALLDDVATWMRASLPADVRLDLGRLVGQVGHPDGEALLLAATGVRDPEGVLDEARRRVAARTDRSAYAGVWRLQAPEVLQPPEPKAEVPWVGTTDEVWFEGDRTAPVSWSGGRPVGPEGAARLLYVGVPGQPSHAALQTKEATRYRIEGKDLAGWVERNVDELKGKAPLARVLLDQLTDVEGAVAPRARALLRWRMGDASGAAEALDDLLAVKKPRPDLYWWRANVALSEGDLDAARTFVASYLKKAPKKGALREAAEGLAASLSA